MNERQQNSNASCKEENTPQVMTICSRFMALDLCDLPSFVCHSTTIPDQRSLTRFMANPSHHHGGFGAESQTSLPRKFSRSDE